jgi:hypothetical protein
MDTFSFRSSSSVIVTRERENHNLPAHYHVERWHPRKIPIIAGATVFDATSFTKWIAGWVNRVVLTKEEEERLGNMCVRIRLFCATLEQRMSPLTQLTIYPACFALISGLHIGAEIKASVFSIIETACIPLGRHIHPRHVFTVMEECLRKLSNDYNAALYEDISLQAAIDRWCVQIQLV